MGGEETNMIEKLERNFYVGMWLIGDEAAKFAVASGLTNSEKEFLDEEFIHEDVLRWEAWDNVHFKTTERGFSAIQ